MKYMVLLHISSSIFEMGMYRNLKLWVDLRMLYNASQGGFLRNWSYVMLFRFGQNIRGMVALNDEMLESHDVNSLKTISEARDDIFPDDARRQQRVLINAAFQWHCPASVCTAADRACQKENCKTYLRLFFERISWELAEYYPRRRSWEQPCHTLGVAQL